MKRAYLFVAGLAVLAMTLVIFITPVFATDTGTATVDSVRGQSLSNVVVVRTHSSWPWYLVRASGLVAGVSLVILMLSGIGSVTGHTFKFLEPLTAWATHRALGIVFIISVGIHMLGLLFDQFVSFNLLSLLVPWAAEYKQVTLFGIHFGSLYVALGVLSFYGALAIVLTSLFWIDKKPKIWKFLHIASYIVITLVFFHALMLGTDTGSGWIRLAWVTGGILVAAAAIARLKRVGTTNVKK